MSGILDTNVVVRYLTGDPAPLAARAEQIIDREPDLQVTDVVLAETAHVLASVYEVPRDEIVDHLIAFIRKRNITPFGLDKNLVIQGLLLCRPSGRVSVADAMIWTAARSSGHGTVYSFDKRFPHDGINIRRGSE